MTGARSLLGCATFAVAVALACTGCGGGSKSAAKAAPDVIAFGKSFFIHEDDLTVIGKDWHLGGAPPRLALPSADEDVIWALSSTIAPKYDEMPPEVRANVVAAACQIGQGKITTDEQLDAYIAGRLVGLGLPTGIALRNDLTELGNDIEQAQLSDDADLKAGVAITCFVAEQAAGAG